MVSQQQLCSTAQYCIFTSCDKSENSFGGEGTQALSEALKANTTLASLGLSRQQQQHDQRRKSHMFDKADNRINGEGLQALSEALKVNTTLTCLNLAGERQQHKTKQSKSVKVVVTKQTIISMKKENEH